MVPEATLYNVDIGSGEGIGAVFGRGEFAGRMRIKLPPLKKSFFGIGGKGGRTRTQQQIEESLRKKYQDIPDVVDHLEKMQADIVDNVGLFLGQPEGQQGLPSQIQQVMESRESAAMRRYAINVLVDRSGLAGAPVVFEDKPAFVDLVGRIEHESEFGSLVTNFNLIRAGSLHQANGGYLVLDAQKLRSVTVPVGLAHIETAIEECIAGKSAALMGHRKVARTSPVAGPPL